LDPNTHIVICLQTGAWLPKELFSERSTNGRLPEYFGKLLIWQTTSSGPFIELGEQQILSKMIPKIFLYQSRSFFCVIIELAILSYGCQLVTQFDIYGRKSARKSE
jgi:hypothetical protein